jgi:hypothetical protein
MYDLPPNESPCSFCSLIGSRRKTAEASDDPCAALCLLPVPFTFLPNVHLPSPSLILQRLGPVLCQQLFHLQLSHTLHPSTHSLLPAMHFPSFLLLTALFASSSVLAAHDDQHSRSSTHARHRRLANKQRAQPVDDRAVLPAVDLGVLPAGPTKMRKRSCRAKTTSNSTLAVSAAVLSPSTASPASPSSTQVVKGLVGGITGGATSIVGDVASVVSSVSITFIKNA